MKFSRRNRVAIVTGSLVALALLSGSIMSFYQARVAIAAGKQKDLALQAAIQSEVEATRARLAVEQFAERLKSANALLASARADEIDGNLLAAKDAYTQAIDLVPNYYLVWIERARFRNRLPLWQEASQDFAQALEIDAPLGIDEWQGVSALFALQGMTGQYDKLTEKLLVAGGDISKSFTWGVARSLLPRKLDDAQAQELAELCRQEVDSQPQPRAFGDGPEGRYYGPRGPGLGQGPGPGLGPSQGRGPRLGKGPGQGTGLGQGPGPAFWPDTDPDDRRPRNRPDRPFGGRSDGDRPPSDRLPGDRPPNGGPANDRDPRYPMHTPFGVQQYVAAWASVRAGNYEKAIEHGELAMQDRGWMGGDSVHALLALAYEASGRHGMAEAELLKSSAAIQDWLDGLGTREPDGAPWFDRVEAVLLHNEASLAVTGKESDLLPALESFQASIRDSLAAPQSQ